MNTLLLAVPFALVIGLSLGLLGGGGSILTVPVLVYVFDVAPKSAIATSLVIVGFTALVGAVRHGRHGNVNLSVALLFGAAGIAGASGGSRFAASRFVPEVALMIAFAVLMVVISTLMIRSRRAPATEEVPHGRRGLIRIGVFGLLTGALTGILGVGGGFVIVPVLLAVAGLPIHRAIGTSLVVIAINCAAGLLGFAGRVPILWSLAALFAGLGVVGSVAGTWLAMRIAPGRLRIAFGVFVLVMGAVILGDQLLRLAA